MPCQFLLTDRVLSSCSQDRFSARLAHEQEYAILRRITTLIALVKLPGGIGTFPYDRRRLQVGGDFAKRPVVAGTEPGAVVELVPGLADRVGWPK